MISRKQLLVLQDMGDGNFTDLVVFDNGVDIVAVQERVQRLWDKEYWTFDDLLAELDKFGAYSLIPMSVIEKIEY